MGERLPDAIYGFTPGWENKPKSYELFTAFVCQSCGLVLPPVESFVGEAWNADPMPCACGGALYRRTLRLEPEEPSGG